MLPVQERRASTSNRIASGCDAHPIQEGRSYLLRERGIGPLGMRSGVLGRFLLRIIGVIGPWFGTMGSAVSRPVNILVGMSLGRARPGWVFLVAGPVADTFEARRVSDRRRWRRRCLISFVERERVTVESKALAIPVRSNNWRKCIL